MRLYANSGVRNLSYCLGEAFLADGNRGAIGAFAPSGLGYVWAHQILDTQLVTKLFQENMNVAGPAVTGAKIAAYAQGIPGDMVEMFTLFGDPATRLRVPQQAASMNWRSSRERLNLGHNRWKWGVGSKAEHRTPNIERPTANVEWRGLENGRR